MATTVHRPDAGAGAWGELLRGPGVRRLVAAGLVARLPMGMNALGVVLLIRDAGESYAGAGVVAAATALASAVGTPVLGRLIDRVGQTRVLVPVAFAFPAALALLIALAQGCAGVALLAASAALAGALVPPISASIRALWPGLVPRPELRVTAYALEASLQEIFFLVGPLLVALLVVIGSPAIAVGVAAAAGALGTLAFAATAPSRAWRPEVHSAEDPRRRGGALADGGVRALALVSLSMGVAFGSFEISMPAFGEAEGNRALGGLALAGISLGSLVGGLWMGSRPSAAGRSAGCWPRSRRSPSCSAACCSRGRSLPSPSSASSAACRSPPPSPASTASSTRRRPAAPRPRRSPGSARRWCSASRSGPRRPGA